MKTPNAKPLLLSVAIAASVSLGATAWAKDTTTLPAQPSNAKPLLQLSDAQMDKVSAGALTLVSPGTSINSCNSGMCYYENPQGNKVGKPVTGY
jgi:hypothetical protein